MTKKKLLVLLVAVLILLAIIFGGSWLKDYLDQKKEEEKTLISLVAMGDSLTEGDGDEKKAGGYVGILDKSLAKHQEVRSVETSNYGVSGNRSDQLLKRLKTEPDFQKAVQKANVITMTIGGNDVMKVLQSKLLDVKVSDFTKAEENFQKNLTEVFSLIREKNRMPRFFLWEFTILIPLILVKSNSLMKSLQIGILIHKRSLSNKKMLTLFRSHS